MRRSSRRSFATVAIGALAARAAARPALAAALLLAAAGVAAPAAAQEVVITQLAPASVVTDGGDFTLTIEGAGFVPGVSRVSFGGRNLTPASVTPDRITVRVANDLVTGRVADDFADDGIARVTVYVINGRGSVTDHPNARKVFHVTRPGVAVRQRPPAPVVTSVGPDPVPLTGTIVVRGRNLDAPELFARLVARDPSARVSTHGLDDGMQRTPTSLRLRVRDVPAGSYTLVIEAWDTDRTVLGTIERPVVVGAPTRLGAPTVAGTNPGQLPMSGGTLTVNGANFADDVRVTLVTPDGRSQALQRAPNRASSLTQVVVLVPPLRWAGAHALRVENPGAGTPAAEHPLAVATPVASGGRGGTELDGGYRPPVATPTPPGRRPPSRGGAGEPAETRAFAVAIVANSNLCLVPDADRDGAEVHLQPCATGGAVFRLENGYVATAGGRCLDWGTEGGAVHLMPCKAGRPDRTSQQWYFHGNKLAQNALNPAVCMDVERERMGVGGRIIAYRCANYEAPVAHQRFYPGGVFPLAQLIVGARLPRAEATKLSTAIGDGGAVVFANGARVVSAGSGNVISAGGGNVISAGSGNVVSAGSGNVVSAGSGNVISAGALNLRVTGDPGSLIRASRVISAGSGNVVSAGGLNVISAGSLNLIGGAGANLSPIPRP